MLWGCITLCSGQVNDKTFYGKLFSNNILKNVVFFFIKITLFYPCMLFLTAYNCTGGQEFKKCGASCTPTCDDPEPVCVDGCTTRCECPGSAPLWEDGQCIVLKQCSGIYA